MSRTPSARTVAVRDQLLAIMRAAEHPLSTPQIHVRIATGGRNCNTPNCQCRTPAAARADAGAHPARTDRLSTRNCAPWNASGSSPASTTRTPTDHARLRTRPTAPTPGRSRLTRRLLAIRRHRRRHRSQRPPRCPGGRMTTTATLPAPAQSVCPAADLLGEGLRWLYDTAQPATAIIDCRGATGACLGQPAHPLGTTGLGMESQHRRRRRPR